MKFKLINEKEITLEDEKNTLLTVPIANIIRTESSVDVNFKLYNILLIVSIGLFFPSSIYLFFSESGSVGLGFEFLVVGFSCSYYLFLLTQPVRKNFDNNNHTITLIIKNINSTNPIRQQFHVGDFENTKSLMKEIDELVRKSGLGLN